jgi:hypothetical protein
LTATDAITGVAGSGAVVVDDGEEGVEALLPDLLEQPPPTRRSSAIGQARFLIGAVKSIAT